MLVRIATDQSMGRVLGGVRFNSTDYDHPEGVRLAHYAHTNQRLVFDALASPQPGRYSSAEKNLGV